MSSIESTKSKPIFSPSRMRTRPNDENNLVEHDLSSSATSEEGQTLLSETVTSLAATVYNELERIIKNFGEDSVKDLMPVMISTLESLNNALHEREVSKLEIDALKEQNEQLFQQYEREKTFHKEYQQRFLQAEDHIEEIKRENEEKLQSLESIVKIFEIKAKNTADHVTRLEDKENEMKQEYKRLHDRYYELFKAHCDYMERTKILYGTDRVDQLPTSANKSNNSTVSRSRASAQLPLSTDEQIESQYSKNRSLTSDGFISDELTTTHVPFKPYKQGNFADSLNKELEDADGKQTQTEIRSSNEVAVNTAEKTSTSSLSSEKKTLKDLAEDFGYDSSSNAEILYLRGILSKIRAGTYSPEFEDETFTGNLEEFELNDNPTGQISEIDDDDDDELKNQSSLYDETRAEVYGSLDADTDLSGMSKEVSNLIKENQELLETKNALNVLKDDLLAQIEDLSSTEQVLRDQVSSLETVKSRLQSRISEVEEELRKTREELDKKKRDEEDDVPSSEKKRFTRVEMQRVLYERNQYKQKLFELEEAIRRHDALRLSKHEQMNSSNSANTMSSSSSFDRSQTKKRSSVLSIFSSLFGSGPKETPTPKRSITTTTLSNTSTVKRSTTADQLSPTTSKQEQINEELLSSTLTATSNESPTLTETANVDLTPPRSTSILVHDDSRLQAYGWSLSSKSQLKLSEVNGKVQVNVPVPVYCRPIFNTSDVTQIWCAVGIDLSGSLATTTDPSVDQLSQQLIESYHQMIDEQCLKLSSIVWIAAKSNDRAMITIIDSNKAEKIIDTFPLGNAIVYAMGSVPGPSSTDYPVMDDSQWTLFEADTALASDVKVSPCTVSSLSAGIARPSVSGTYPPEFKDLRSSVDPTNESVSTKFPTVWMGSGDGWLYIHSAISEHRTTIEKIWLRHAIYSIVHLRGRVFVSLANEKIVVFHRSEDGRWDLNNIHLIVTGKSRESVRCMIHVGESIWCGVANRIYVIDAQTLEVRKQFDVHTRPEHSVQHMTWSSDGVWLSTRLSSTLQLYHAHNYQHLQDVDVQPYVEKMITTEKAGLYFVHISALTIACRRLWIGTGNGIIISVPLTDTSLSAPSMTKPGSVVRVYDQTSSSSYIPYCSMNNAQLSFHGYRDAVKFFVAVPGQPSTKLLQDSETTSEPMPSTASSNTTDTSNLAFGDILVVSGGDGYIDFRIGDSQTEKNDETSMNNRNISYLIVWHLGSI